MIVIASFYKVKVRELVESKIVESSFTSLIDTLKELTDLPNDTFGKTKFKGQKVHS